MRDELYQFLNKRIPKLCVAATVTKEGKPECAAVGYAVLEDLTLIFTTSKKSRKWQNLSQNPHIALTIGQSFTESNLQYEGSATLLTDGEKYENTDKLFYAFRPDLLQYKSLDNGFVEVKPTWVRFMDFTDGHHKVREEDFTQIVK